MHTFRYILSLICVLCSYGLLAQRAPGPYQPPPRYGIKSNMLYLLTGSLNVAFEQQMSSNTSLDIQLGYNPWEMGSDRKYKNLLLQPELRYHLSSSQYSIFTGPHIIYTYYNVARMRHPFAASHSGDRYEGKGIGAGISLGKTCLLSDVLSLEFCAGVGFVKLEYDRFEPGDCGRFIESGKHNYYGPTRLGLSIIYNLW